MGFWVRFLFLAIVSLILVTFAVHNREAVALSLFPLPWLMEVPTYLLALGCFVLGFGCATLLTFWGRAQLRLKHRHSHQRAQALEMELSALRVEKQLEVR